MGNRKGPAAYSHLGLIRSGLYEFSDYSQRMDRAMVSQVRRFNRIVTQRVGALNDRFLARDRPLGEARVLWEIGTEGREVRSLRAQLELDSGYLSRLLRSLEISPVGHARPQGLGRAGSNREADSQRKG